MIPNYQENVVNSYWLSERENLAPLNELVNKLNSKMIDTMPASSNLYKSIDIDMSDDEANHYPPDFSKFHRDIRVTTTFIMFNIKVGMPVKILRSFNPSRLMNGTRQHRYKKKNEKRYRGENC